MNKCEKCGFLHYRTDPCRKPKVRIGTEASDNALTTPKSSVSAEPPSDVKVHTQSTAARKDVLPKGGPLHAIVSRPSAAPVADRKSKSGQAGTQALPVDTNSQHAKNEIAPISQTMPSTTFSGTVGDKDRKPKFDKKAWMREYMREHRRGIRRRAAK